MVHIRLKLHYNCNYKIIFDYPTSVIYTIHRTVANPLAGSRDIKGFRDVLENPFPLSFIQTHAKQNSAQYCPAGAATAQ